MKLSLAVVVLACVASLAHAAPPNLFCALEGLTRDVKPNEVCNALASELQRPVALIDDARAARKGEAVQLITGDVAWTVVWLIDGKVRAWTRVSKIDPVAEQVKLLARAARELARQATSVEPVDATCLRVLHDQKPDEKPRSDVRYPWAELKPCKRKLVEVVDPWWLPPGQQSKPAP